MFKITIDKLNNEGTSEKSISFYTSSLDGEFGLLNSPFFETTITDAKTLSSFCIKDEIAKALNIPIAIPQ